jgi:hypothetical protein
VKPGHRKSHSLSGIQLKGDVPPPVGNPVEDWVRGGIISRSIGHEFHFFSDTEMEIRSPDGSRPPTPVHSDTEYEVGSYCSRSFGETHHFCFLLFTNVIIGWPHEA